jgi:hypothetical protein
MDLRDRRFSDARSVDELARMLDEYVLKQKVMGSGLSSDISPVVNTESPAGRARSQPSTRFPNALFTTNVQGPKGMNVGTLVRIYDDRYVVLADAVTPVPASDVVVAVLGEDSYVVASVAVLDVNIDNPGTGNARELWLGLSGGFGNTPPATGRVQKVGLNIGKKSNNLYTCRFMPDFLGGIS